MSEVLASATVNQPRPERSAALRPEGLLRLRQVLDLIPISRSAWWAGVRAGRYPRPLKLSPNTTCWRAADILKLIETLDAQGADAS